MQPIRSAAGRLVNTLLRPFKLRLQPYHPATARKVHFWRYENVLRELHDLLVQTAFPGLPETEGRLELLGQLEGQSVVEAMWILHILHRALATPGDVCEFGCASGATSALIANEMRGHEKLLWLFDSFQGLPQPSPQDRLLDDVLGLGHIERYQGRMAFSADSVRDRLNRIAFPAARTRIVAGFIEETVRSSPLPDQVCFALVDFDFYEPVKTALHCLSERVPPGGQVIVDDYGYFSTGARNAVDEFAAAHAGRFELQVPPEWAGRFAILRRIPANT